MSTSQSRPDPYQAVTDLILEHLERGAVPWRCPWDREVGQPRNFRSGRPYRGINALLLGWRHHASPWWLTFRQAQERGGHVRKGERGAMIVKYGTFESKCAAEQTMQEVSPKRGYLRAFTVFNASQIDGIEFPAATRPETVGNAERSGRAEAIILGMPNPPVIDECDTVRASYSLREDRITIPLLSRFESADGYYTTLFHEVCHSVGHPKRLDRESLTAHDEFGGPVYSREELVAEMGAAFLAMEAGIVTDRHEQSAAYLNGWLTALRAKEHRRWIVTAASQAAKAADYVLNRTPVPA
ncbi:MAG TPA: ArdC-like ssDNA-binding domain-containing protein [Verrucomicrobiales bacterium]|nr:ArdC-like ssDNA-binding domain-containing protein [Verrucomicrobiales bacterium]